VDFLGPRACVAKVAPKMASRGLSGRPRGAAGTPKTAPRGAKSAPRRSQEAPGEAQEPPSDGFGAALAAALGPPGAQEARGDLRELILDPGEAHFGGSGGRFLSAPDAHLRSAAGKQSSNRAHMQKHAMHLS